MPCGELRDILVLVVDDDQAIREEISGVLERDGAQTIGFASGSSFLAEIAQLPPAVVLLDLGLPGRTGLEILSALDGRALLHRFIVLTGRGSVPTAVSAMRSGAHDFIEKPVRSDRLRDAVRSAADEVRRAIAERDHRADIVRRTETLSPRERDVLAGLMTGHRNKSIAKDLGLNVRTVEMHRSNLMQKLGARTIAHAITMGLLAAEGVQAAGSRSGCGAA